MAEAIIEQIEDFALSAKEKPKAEFSKVGIIAKDPVGHRLTVMIASKGIDVYLLEENQERISKALQDMEESLDGTINHWGMTVSDKKLTLSRIHGITNYDDLKDCDLVVETTPATKDNQDLKLRQEIFKKIEEVVSPNTIIATNSTLVGITELATPLKNPERCVCMHFPLALSASEVVEVVKSIYTTDEVYENIQRFCTLIGKRIIHVEESPGLLTVRLGVSIISEACKLLSENLASVEDIDNIMKQGLGFPIGAFELADKIGINRIEAWMLNLYREFGDPKYMPAPIIKRMVRTKRHGRETNQGFYKYNK